MTDRMDHRTPYLQQTEEGVLYFQESGRRPAYGSPFEKGDQEQGHEDMTFRHGLYQ